jgi:bifunctional non-homologous end joining protein LigD
VAEPERAVGVLRLLLPIRIEPQLLTASREPPEGDRWIHEVKYDGYRLLCRVEHGHARLFTRPGNDWTNALPGIAAAVEALDTGDAYLDGELVALGPDGAPDFEALRRSIAGGDDPLVVGCG